MSLTPNEIVFHLQEFLPTFSDKFSTQITGTATALGTTVTVSAIAHGLSVSDPIVVSAGVFENLLIGATDTGDGTVRFETDQDHDLTEPQQFADPTTLTLVDFGNVWDGVHEIDSVPNRKFFEIKFPSGETVPPALGTGKLLEPRSAGIIGNQVVATVPDVDTFTFVVTNVPSLPTGDIPGFKASSSMRIWGASSIKRASQLYNREAAGKHALFVIMTDVTTSKDRSTGNDAIGAFTPQNFQKQTQLNNFATVVFIPTKDDIAGNDAQQEAFGDLYRALLQVLYGFQFEDSETTLTYVTVSVGHGAAEDNNNAYYVHVYDWQRPDVISAEQGFALSPDVAFRDMDATLKNFNDPEAELKGDVNLDDEPI